MSKHVYTIYNNEGINIEEHILIESFETVGRKLGECLESECTLAISPAKSENGENDDVTTLQIVPVTDQDGNQAIMVSFENGQGEYCRFYEQPYTDEKIQEILQYLHTYCVQGVNPDVTEPGWISAGDENRDYRPEIAAYYVDAMSRPYCKSVEGILYLMFDGIAQDDYSLMSLEDMDWNIKNLKKVDAGTAGQAAQLHKLIENAFFTFWIADDGSVFAVNHLDMVFRVTQEPNGQLTLSAPPGLKWQPDWKQISLEDIKR